MVPTSKTMKSLFARSGNRCAFPDCYVPLVEENDIVTGEVCHIKARNARGPRHDPSQTDEERNDSANLILLCARHHKIVDDDPVACSAPVLCAMKKERESVGEITITPAIARRAELLRQSLIIKVEGDLSVSAIHTQNLTIKSAGRVKLKTTFPADVIGGSSSHRAYLKYLIERYQDFAKAQKVECWWSTARAWWQCLFHPRAPKMIQIRLPKMSRTPMPKTASISRTVRGVVAHHLLKTTRSNWGNRQIARYRGIEVVRYLEVT